MQYNRLLYQHLVLPINLIMGDYIHLLPFWLVLFFFSVVMHEMAHGYAALKSGDDTASLMGRITLNPLPHIDPIGTVVLPLILIISGTGIIFGWAKPVPINPYNFYNYRQGMIKVSLAGVLTNFAIATVLAIVVYMINISGFHTTREGANIIILLTGVASINIILGIFNLIPVPPLDGSNLLSVLLPDDIAQSYDRLKPYGFFIIIILFMIGILGFIILFFGNILYRLLFMGLPL